MAIPATIGQAIAPLLASAPQAALTYAAGAVLALVPVGAVWSALDARRLHGEALAAKPMRFAASIGVYLLTVSWMLGFARPERLSSRAATATVAAMLLGTVVEVSLICLQALRGRASHFNRSTRLDATIYAVMGAFAVLAVGTLLPVAWIVASTPAPGASPLMVAAVVTGLLATFLLGGATGAAMGGGPPGPLSGPRVPVFGWRLCAEDPRIGHFLGLHALQAMPLAAAVMPWLIGVDAAPACFAVAAILYAAATIALLRRSISHRRRDAATGRRR